ncbi:hypothetical protein HN803_00235 [candidate division WWE3 bacterium]|jgi:Tfp pilus assembly protein PilN|nr:hypothetical protein [candidate division WWE3 bacterium]MBT7349213.1 hypothetical protein [candidate division WWE3 bacterium]
MANINLIPQSEKQEQVKQKAVKTSTVLAIVLFLIVGAIGGYMFYQSTTINKQIASHEDNISNLRGDIQRLEAIEISARNLGQRYSTLKELLSSRNYYSILMEEFEKRIPSTVEIETFGIGRGNTINVSGTGADYIAIAKFVNDLANSNFPQAGEGLGGVFTDVALNSVNLDAQTNKARFFIVVTLDEALLR